MTDARTSLSRILVWVLGGAILLQLVLMFPAVYRALAATPPPDYDIVETVSVVAVGLAAGAIMIIGWREQPRVAIALFLVVAASALLTPGAVLLVTLMLANAYVLGRSLLRWIGPDVERDDPVPWTAALLTGYSAWIGVMAATASLRVHFLPVYALALAIPLIHGRDDLRDAATSLWRELSRPWRTTWTEAGWLALLVVIAVVHLFVVAKPEVGHDANVLHLQFAHLLANQHRWDFDVTRNVWADMPLGADLSFAAAYILGGEPAARALNLAFCALACLLVYQLIRRYARTEIALAGVCLLASMPLVYLESGSLLVEGLWSAFLLAALLTALDYARTRSAATLAACAMLAAGAMQTKVIGVIWLVPLGAAVVILVLRGGGYRLIGGRGFAIIIGALAIAAWPYANAWIRTGNPVFPFMNDVFRSPYFDSATAFTNRLYETPLRWTSLYDLFLSSGRFIEGSDGAAGWQWPLLLAAIVVVFVLRRRPLAQWLCAGLAAIFFVGVFSQQAYLRYLLPFFMLMAVLGGWSLEVVAGSRAARLALLTVGGIVCLLNLRFIYAAAWQNQTLCLRCTVEDSARSRYLARYAPDRVIADYLNLVLPTARVGFFALGAPGNSGFLGYSRGASWHDVPVHDALSRAATVDDIRTIARDYRLTHVVLWEPAWDTTGNLAIAAFRDRYTMPVWRFAGRIVAAVKPE